MQFKRVMSRIALFNNSSVISSIVLAIYLLWSLVFPFAVFAAPLEGDELWHVQRDVVTYRAQGAACGEVPGGAGAGNGTLSTNVPEPWRSLILNAAPKYPEVDPRIVAAVLWVEHRGWPEYRTTGWAVSEEAGAQGPFQFIPETWASLGTDGDGDGIKDPNNPKDAVEAAFKHHLGSAGKPITTGTLTGDVERDYLTATYENDTLLNFAAKYNGSKKVWPAPGTKLTDLQNTQNHNYVLMVFWLLDSDFSKGILMPQKERVEAATSKGSGGGPEQTTVITDSGSTTSCNTGAGGVGLVSTDGYSFPVAPQRKNENKAPYMSALPCQNSGGCHHDGTAGFDISRKPGGDETTGTPIYAISDGVVKNIKNSYKGEEGCQSFQLESSKDKFWYWHGHIQNVSVPEGGAVTAGQQIAVIGERRCTGNGSDNHLHIDRGCIRDGKPQPGGSDSCRDAGIVPLINSLFEGLPD